MTAVVEKNQIDEDYEHVDDVSKFVQIQYWKKYNKEAYEWWSERAAVIEYDHCVSRKQAEQMAYRLAVQIFQVF